MPAQGRTGEQPPPATGAPAAVFPDHGWPRGPAAPVFEHAAVHVWLLDLDGPAPPDALSDAERARAERIVREPARNRWANCRSLLRALLGRYTGGDPRDLDLQTDTHGKPWLPGARAPAFNLSHSGTTALCALAAAGSVGVDVEELRREIDVEAIAPRALGAAAAAELAAIADPLGRRREFLRLWVRREAAVKAAGHGLAGPVPLTGSHSICELEICERALGAVATPVVPSLLRCWRWPPVGDG